MERSFKIISVTTVTSHIKGEQNLTGRYKSKTPISAAKKAVTNICKKSKIKGQCTLIITIQETTKNSKNKLYVYKIKRIKKITKVIRGDKEIVFKYTLKAKKIKSNISLKK